MANQENRTNFRFETSSLHSRCSTLTKASHALSEIDREKLFRLIPDLNDTVMANQENLYEFSIRDILIAFQMQHVDPTLLEEFIKFLQNAACRQFMGELSDDVKTIRVGGLYAVVTLFRVFYVGPIGQV